MLLVRFGTDLERRPFHASAGDGALRIWGAPVELGQEREQIAPAEGDHNIRRRYEI
jgi:hypothetical protein